MRGSKVEATSYQHSTLMVLLVVLFSYHAAADNVGRGAS